MKVVIDTNVLLMSLPRRSKFRPIFDGLLKGAYELVITEDILQEYIEIIGQKTTGSIAQNLAELLVKLQNVEKAEVYFRWQLIEADPDDNKFVDCAISASVAWLVTNDKHFSVLKQVDFPAVPLIDAEGFLAEVERLLR